MNGEITWRGDRFPKRNGSELKASNLKVIGAGRVNDESQQACEEFITVMEETVAKFNMTAESTINVDGFQLKVSGYSAGR